MPFPDDATLSGSYLKCDFPEALPPATKFVPFRDKTSFYNPMDVFRVQRVAIVQFFGSSQNAKTI
ncbi:MAG TPA: hypothetical protein VFP47_09100, partial [Pyrinomonadaceae bacterium]|nr:hypothetical protein [Pyrinomonadaceae bacterium]